MIKTPMLTIGAIFRTILGWIVLLFAFSSLLAQDGSSKPKLTGEAKLAREHSLAILDEMEDILNENYYDPKFHNIDLKARINAAKERVKTMQYNWQMYRVLAQVLLDFDDSHTRFMLPPRSDYFSYGFGVQMIGDECYITSVGTKSDAKEQGLAVGDHLLRIGKYEPSRQHLWKIMYVLYRLDPVNTIDLKVRKPDGSEKVLTVKAKTMTDKEYRAEQKARKAKRSFEPFKCSELSASTIACKLYTFIIDNGQLDKMMKQAAKYPKFILDLRGNGGGYVVAEQYLLSYFFDQRVKIANLVLRKKTEERFTKPNGDKYYKGEVAVLVDSNSASAAEITARVLQIEKRAKIYGDYSSGSVMTSVSVPFTRVMSALSIAAIIRVGMSVTVADVKMSDGSRLEKTGITPDEGLLPTAEALARKTDPLLAYVAVKFGVELTPEKAGQLYFLTPKEEGDDDDSEGSEEKP